MDASAIAPTTTAIEKDGLFLTPGKKAERLEMFENGRVNFRSAQGDESGLHGNWHPWQTGEEQRMITVSFHHKGSEAVKDLRSIGEAKPDPALDGVQVAAFTGITSLILNLDEVITKE